ncbi:MAG: CinA family nicotinamide mononucleotide deamidase-related protein [Deltaproteobacteria bacterium]|nr:CinA family nicotinamide mononucleotide deamidase-related protein [Deltaproteobacteria bacterium]
MSQVNAEIVAIGSELLLGQIVDTNSAWMAQRLSALGINLFYKTVVGDNPGRMREVIDRALERSDLVITSGGLGPTQDDLTREIVAEVAGRKLVLSRELQDQVENRFRRRGLTMTPNNMRQAYMPEGAIPVENPNGTAPSFIVEDPRGVIFVLPGVPWELKWLFDNEVVPYVRKKFDLAEVITYKVLKVADMGESSVDDRIGHLIANSNNPTVGVLAHPGQVDVRITAKAANNDEAKKLIVPLEEEVRRLLGLHVFATDDETMEDVVGRLLREKNTTIAVYEDLTGGLVTERLQQAGADHFVEGVIGSGVVSLRRLLVSSRLPDRVDDLLAQPTQLTDELAWAVRAQAKCQYGLALHAVADPNDKAENMARGQTYISITDGKGFKTRVTNMAGRGRPDRTRMSQNAMGLLRLALLEGL